MQVISRHQCQESIFSASRLTGGEGMDLLVAVCSEMDIKLCHGIVINHTTTLDLTVPYCSCKLGTRSMFVFGKVRRSVIMETTIHHSVDFWFFLCGSWSNFCFDYWKIMKHSVTFICSIFVKMGMQLFSQRGQ